MSDPRRYLDDAEAPAEARSLLQSASNDGLDDARTAAVARALGVAPAAPESRPAPPRSGKWLIGGAALASVSALAIFAATRHAPPPAVVVSAPPSVEPAAPPPLTSDAISVAQLPEAPAVPAAPSIVPARAAPSAVLVDDLPAQLRALEDVRRALAEHRSTDARAGLTSYDRTFPKKRLAAEARVLDIETLFVEGRTSDAQSEGRAFLVAAPDSPYASRIRSLLAEHP